MQTNYIPVLKLSQDHPFQIMYHMCG